MLSLAQLSQLLHLEVKSKVALEQPGSAGFNVAHSWGSGQPGEQKFQMYIELPLISDGSPRVNSDLDGHIYLTSCTCALVL